MSQEIDIEKIEQYLSGQLTGQELAAFEEALSSNKELARQVELMRDLDLALADEKAIEVQRTIQEVGNNFFAEQPVSTKDQPTGIKRLPFYRRPLAIAASILFIVAAAALIWQMNMGNSRPSNEALFAQYYRIESINSSVRGNAQTDSLYTLALNQYQNQQYESAINQLTALLAEDPNNLQLTYTLAHAYLNNQQATEAKTQLNKIIVDGKSILTPKAIWYLALIELREGNIEAAKQQLEALSKTEEPQLVKQALELLNTL